MNKTFNSIKNIITPQLTNPLTTGGLCLVFFIFLLIEVGFTIWITKHYLPNHDIDNLGTKLIYYAHRFSLFVLLILLLSILLEFKHGANMFEDSSSHAIKTERKWHLHWHGTYSKLAGLGIAIVALLYTIYSDVFYQHGNPITPVLYGLLGNQTSINVSAELRKKETVHLIYLLDVSRSTKHTTKKDRAWINYLKDRILSIHDKPSFASEAFDNLNKNEGINLIKLKACELLFKDRERIKTDTNKVFRTTILTFGKYTDYYAKKVDIRDSATFKNCIDSILGLSYREIQSDSTNYERAITRLSDLVDGVKDKFKPQENKVTILSDFKMDTLQSVDTSLLKLLITEIADKSTFFNLVLINANIKLLKGELDVLPFFKSCIYPRLIKVYDIDGESGTLNTYFTGKEIVFIVDENFHAEKITTHILYKDQDSIKITIANRRHGEDEWQEFFMDGKVIRYEHEYPNPTGGFDLQFSGYVVNQFPGVKADFYFPKKSTVISSEILFKKGLKPFVAKLILWLTVYLTFFTLIYLSYLLYRFIISLNRGRRKIFIKENVEIKNAFKQGVSEIKETIVISEQSDYPK